MCSVVKQVTEYGSLFICTCILFIYICIPFTGVWRGAGHSIRLPVYFHLYSVYHTVVFRAVFWPEAGHSIRLSVYFHLCSVYLQLYLDLCSGLKQVTV